MTESDAVMFHNPKDKKLATVCVLFKLMAQNSVFQQKDKNKGKALPNGFSRFLGMALWTKEKYLAANAETEVVTLHIGP